MKLTDTQVQALREEFGRVPQWVIDRDPMTMDEARHVLTLRNQATDEANAFFSFRRAARGR